jgi:quercetin dioxygenase-like cupin family protein
MKLYPLPEQPIDEAFFCVDEVFLRRIRVKQKGVYLPQHYHKFAHNTLVARGEVRAYKSSKRHDEMAEGEAPEMVLIGDFSADGSDVIWIEAGYHHQFVTLTENVKLCCLHNTHGADAEVILAEAPALTEELP